MNNTMAIDPSTSQDAVLIRLSQPARAGYKWGIAALLDRDGKPCAPYCTRHGGTYTSREAAEQAAIKQLDKLRDKYPHGMFEAHVALVVPGAQSVVNLVDVENGEPVRWVEKGP